MLNPAPMPSEFIPVWIFAVFAAAFFAIAFAVWRRLRPAAPTTGRTQAQRETASAPEEALCDGADSASFYMAGALFVILSVVVVFLFPLAVEFNRVGVAGLLAVVVFLGILLAGYAWIYEQGALDWPGSLAANPHAPLIGVLRALASLGSCGIAAVASLASIVLLAGSLSMNQIVTAQSDQGMWFIFYAPVAFAIFFASSAMALGLARRDSRNAPRERGAGAGEARQGIGFLQAIAWLAEHANKLLISAIATTAFLGGWLRPFANHYQEHFFGISVEILDMAPSLAFLVAAAFCFRLMRRHGGTRERRLMAGLGGLCVVLATVMAAALFASPGIEQGLHGAFWFLLKVLACTWALSWLEHALPRRSWERGMRLGWRLMVPLALVNAAGVAIAIMLRQEWGWSPGWSLALTTLAVLCAGVWLAERDAAREEANAMASGEAG